MLRTVETHLVFYKLNFKKNMPCGIKLQYKKCLFVYQLKFRPKHYFFLIIRPHLQGKCDFANLTDTSTYLRLFTLQKFKKLPLEFFRMGYILLLRNLESNISYFPRENLHSIHIFAGV